MKIIFTIFLIFLSLISTTLAQTQFGELGLYYTPSAYAILPGVYEFGIFGHKQFDRNNIESPAPIFFSMGLAPRIEGFASFPDIFSLGEMENVYQQYGNIGLKVRVASRKNKRLRFAVTTYLRYLTNSNIAGSFKNLPGCILHASLITTQGKIFHCGLDGYQEAMNRINFKLNFGVETFFIKDYLIFYFDSYLSPIKKKQWKKEWMGIVSIMQWFPHRVLHLETGVGLEMYGKQGLIFFHLGLVYSSGQRIAYRLREKKDELPKPPPLDAVLQSSTTGQ